MTDKSQRYDRQLRRVAFFLVGVLRSGNDLTHFRLWGEDGQTRLESAKILLLNASATGAEALKNLVLPGMQASPFPRHSLRSNFKS
jgi:molybdopterin/thiamine biosynthesis adenylyltransferase